MKQYMTRREFEDREIKGHIEWLHKTRRENPNYLKEQEENHKLHLAIAAKYD